MQWRRIFLGRHNKSTLPAAVCLAVALGSVWCGIAVQLFATPSVVLSEKLAQIHHATGASTLSTAAVDMTSLSTQPPAAYGNAFVLSIGIILFGLYMAVDGPKKSQSWAKQLPFPSKSTPEPSAPEPSTPEPSTPEPLASASEPSATTVAVAVVTTPESPLASSPVNPPVKPQPDDDEELAFTEGQRVMILGPLAMKGMQGDVVAPVPNKDAFAVRLESGSVFNLLTENLQDATEATPAAAVVPTEATPAAAVVAAKLPMPEAAATAASASTQESEEELEFTEGQRVVILGPPAMKGKQGSILAHLPNKDAFAVRLDSGSAFNILTENLQDADAAAPAITETMAPPAIAAPAAPVNPSMPKASMHELEGEVEFTEGQRVVISAPPAMKGKQANIVRQLPEKESFAVRLDSGSVFNISTENLQAA